VAACGSKYNCFLWGLRCTCVQVRKVMNALDNERESRATDMLLNYETIKYFCAEGPELSGYDTATRKYQVSVPSCPVLSCPVLYCTFMMSAPSLVTVGLEHQLCSLSSIRIPQFQSYHKVVGVPEWL
jgi:ABC-type transport system involved in Fe-S cluster assembly fused permease/ATPase subunit